MTIFLFYSRIGEEFPIYRKTKFKVDERTKWMWRVSGNRARRLNCDLEFTAQPNVAEWVERGIKKNVFHFFETGSGCGHLRVYRAHTHQLGSIEIVVTAAVCKIHLQPKNWFRAEWVRASDGKPAGSLVNPISTESNFSEFTKPTSQAAHIDHDVWPCGRTGIYKMGKVYAMRQQRCGCTVTHTHIQ